MSAADNTLPIVITERKPDPADYAVGQRLVIIANGNFYGNFIKCRNWAREAFWCPADRYWELA